MTLRLRDDVAGALRAALAAGAPSPASGTAAEPERPDAGGKSGEVRAVARAAGAALESIDAGGEGELAHWFVATVPSVAAAHALRRRLAACDGVEAAYVKGEDAPPSA